MKAILFEEFQGPLNVVEVADPRAASDGVVIEVRATGLCRSDWHGWMGHDSDVKLPHVPGHEFAGVVVERGPLVRKFAIGDRVTVPFCVGCGTCEQCEAGHQQVCDNYFQPGFTGWGSFAERVAIPHADANLVALPDALDFESAASLGCRFVTSYRAVIAQGKLQPGEWLAVYGCGGVGLAAIQIGVAQGAHVVAIDVNPTALELARQLGAAQCVRGDTTGENNRAVVAQVRAATHGGAHVSVDAIGSLSSCLQSIRSLRKRGRHVQVGLMVGEQRNAPVPMHLVIANELTLVGSHGMSATAYAPLLARIIAGELRPAQLLAERIGLADIATRLPDLPKNEHAGIILVV
ncbi:MAG: zinc-dependent alcohol dehydrogenase family protein [Planctomycetales bacterium]|nr:zinc-dependent alcohol dehydrogenase family protein [Planctomycetales bacterium]